MSSFIWMSHFTSFRFCCFRWAFRRRLSVSFVIILFHYAVEVREKSSRNEMEWSRFGSVVHSFIRTPTSHRCCLYAARLHFALIIYKDSLSSKHFFVWPDRKLCFEFVKRILANVIVMVMVFLLLFISDSHSANHRLGVPSRTIVWQALQRLQNNDTS